ncbi:MAG: SDR family oxidoreductase [Eubacteriales bacterium]|nr:SDR family oxidoreductase [Eubacteriales bacterium]
MGKLDGKVAIVTGAGQGVGRGIALALAKEGAFLSLPSRTASKVEALKEEIEAFGGAAIAFGCDVGEKEQVIHAVKKTVEVYGTVDILINNAQTTVPAHSLLDYTDEEVDRVFKSGYWASLWFMKECYPYLKEQNGCVINFASAIGLNSVPGYLAYASTKEAIRSLSRIAAKEWGRDGIRVNVIVPGAESPGNTQAIIDLAKWSESSGIKASFGTPAIPRKGRPEEDIGRVAVFLCSEDASFLSGYTYCVDGGYCIDASR